MPNRRLDQLARLCVFSSPCPLWELRVIAVPWRSILCPIMLALCVDEMTRFPTGVLPTWSKFPNVTEMVANRLTLGGDIKDGFSGETLEALLGARYTTMSSTSRRKRLKFAIF